MGRKRTSLDRRLNQIRKEMSAVEGGIRALAKTVEAERRRRPAVRAAPPEVPEPEPEEAGRPESPWREPDPASGPPARASRERRPSSRDDRLASYLSTGAFDSVQPLLHERRIQRNKAIVTLLVAAAALLWLVFNLKKA
jgi:hypothetical protein